MSDSDERGPGPDRTGAVKLGALDPQGAPASPTVGAEPPATRPPGPPAEPPPATPARSAEPPPPSDPSPELYPTSGEAGPSAGGAAPAAGGMAGAPRSPAMETARVRSDRAVERDPVPPGHARVAAPLGDPPFPPSRERSPIGRKLIIGGLAALAAGAALALLFRPGLEREQQAAPAAAQGAGESPVEGAAAADAGPAIAAAREPFQPPDREAVRQAYARAAEVYQAQGASGLAQFGQECFRSLQNGATYRQLDFCLAFDAYGAAIAQRASGGQVPAENSYFGQTETRHLRVAEAVMAGQSDASSRLVDIRRIAIEVARETGPVAPARAAAPARPGPAQPSPPAPVYAETTPPPPARVAPPPRPAPVEPSRRAEAPGLPSAAEVAAARPSGPGPSFSCRSARTRSERLVCADPALASLDRRLNAAFEDAIAAGADRRQLRREQDRWLAEREAAAPDPEAVADAYRRRIVELNRMR